MFMAVISDDFPERQRVQTKRMYALTFRFVSYIYVVSLFDLKLISNTYVAPAFIKLENK